MQRPPANWDSLTCYVAFNSVELFVLVNYLSPCTSLCAKNTKLNNIFFVLFFKLDFLGKDTWNYKSNNQNQ